MVSGMPLFGALMRKPVLGSAIVRNDSLTGHVGVIPAFYNFYNNEFRGKKIMSVERRYNKRHPMKVEVYIRYRKQQVFPANAANCSMQGIFLQTRNLTMITGAMVELEFFYSARHWTITGIVTHVQLDGIGIMFWRSQPELYDACTATNADFGNFFIHGVSSYHLS